jgi:hypothetical protein
MSAAGRDPNRYTSSAYSAGTVERSGIAGVLSLCSGGSRPDGRQQSPSGVRGRELLPWLAVARGSLLDEDRCGVVVDLVTGPAYACRVGGFGGPDLADEFAGPGDGEDGEKALPVAEPEWVY